MKNSFGENFLGKNISNTTGTLYVSTVHGNPLSQTSKPYVILDKRRNTELKKYIFGGFFAQKLSFQKIYLAPGSFSVFQNNKFNSNSRVFHTYTKNIHLNFYNNSDKIMPFNCVIFNCNNRQKIRGEKVSHKEKTFALHR